jgi:hypothetical protein
VDQSKSRDIIEFRTTDSPSFFFYGYFTSYRFTGTNATTGLNKFSVTIPLCLVNLEKYSNDVTQA